MPKKNVPVVRLVDRDEAAELRMSEELRVVLTEVVGAAREGLLAMSVGIGLRVFVEMMDEELTTKVGPKHAKSPGARPAGMAPRRARLCWAAAASGSSDRGPHHRGCRGGLRHLRRFADDDLLSAVVMGRMLAGLATRRHRAANEPVGEAVDAEARSTSKSSVSRRFVARTKKALAELMARDLSGLEAAALMIDGFISPSTAAWWPWQSAPTAPRSPSGCGWATPRTRPTSPTCSPTWSTAAYPPRVASS